MPKEHQREMIDACGPLRRSAKIGIYHHKTTTSLHWMEEWQLAAGRGVVVGLLDTGCNEHISDLVSAKFVTRDFTGFSKAGADSYEHGTHSVTLLIGQGHDQIRGLVPHAHLLLAKVIGSDSTAHPMAVVEAIKWLIFSGAQIIVIPLGESVWYEEIAQQIERYSESGVLFFAAAGNAHPDQLLFPARHPNTIAVGAADSLGNLLPECCRHPRLDLVAPGWKIAALIQAHTIRERSGSSVACVIAAGVAALALSARVIPMASMDRKNILAVLRGECSARSPP